MRGDKLSYKADAFLPLASPSPCAQRSTHLELLHCQRHGIRSVVSQILYAYCWQLVSVPVFSVPISKTSLLELYQKLAVSVGRRTVPCMIHDATFRLILFIVVQTRLFPVQIHFTPDAHPSSSPCKKSTRSRSIAAEYQ